MERLVKGIRNFQSGYFRLRRKLFERLAEAQSPETMFITCADSRVAPSLLMQAEPGSLFTLRNAGNIVPPYGVAQGGESATIEYGVAVLGVKHIIVCGHSQCGAIKALLRSEEAKELPAVRAWLAHAEPIRRVIEENYDGLDEAARLDAAIKENVLAQLANLRTHPTVAAKLAEGELQMHGWFYQIKSGEVFAYDSEQKQFVDLKNAPPAPRRSRVSTDSVSAA